MVRMVGLRVVQKAAVWKDFLDHRLPSRWKVALSTLRLSAERLTERQPIAFLFQLIPENRMGSKSLTELTDRLRHVCKERSVGSVNPVELRITVLSPSLPGGMAEKIE